jgi:fatty-acid desaturase
MNLCEYKNILGEPNTGVHSYRIGQGIFNKDGFALVDIVMTIISALIIGKITGTGFTLVFVLLMVMSIALHALFCVDTTTNAILGLNQ